MATVYLAHDLKHDREVALKVLNPELAAVLGVPVSVRRSPPATVTARAMPKSLSKEIGCSIGLATPPRQ